MSKNQRVTVRYLAVMLTTILMLAPAQRSLAQGSNQAPKRDLKIIRKESVREWPTSSKRFALVIGVDEYFDTQIDNLEGATNDAKALAHALTEYAGFPKDQVVLLASDQAPERRPTLGNVLRRLSNLRSIVPRDGLLLFSFAGHGMERDGRAYLLPADAQVTEDVGLLKRTAINVADISEWIREAAVQQVVLILDACRSDPAAGRSNNDNLLTEAFVRGFSFEERNQTISAFATLYATGIGHRAFEYKEKKQGYFSWALVEGLKGGAANERGEITLSALVNFVQEQVPRRILMDLGGGKNQQPFAEIGGYKASDLIIAFVPRKPALSGNSTQPGAFDPIRIELTFWETIKDSRDPAEFQAYLDKYPNGEFAVLARRRAQQNPLGANEPVSTNPETKIPASPPTGGAENPLSKPTGAQRPWKTSTIDVIGTRDWCSSGLIVKRGDRVRISATGSVKLDKEAGTISGPEGVSNLADPKKLMPDQPTGALIGVIAADNDDFIFIGRTIEFTAMRDGLLFLSVNEGTLSDNTGAYRAVIEVQQKSK